MRFWFMREMIRDKSRLGHILESIDNVFEFIEVVHGYYQIEDFIAWDTASNDLRPLKEQIKTIYDNEI